MSESISDRADRLFRAATPATEADAQAIFSLQSSKSRLQSGSTIRQVVDAFSDRSRAALEEALASVASRVDHRGRRWRKMLAEVSGAIDKHMNAAPAVIDRITRPVVRNGEERPPQVDAIIEPRLDALRADLHARLADYREGWTAPREKRWHERHPFIYAILLIVAGAMLGEAIKFGWTKLAPPKSPFTLHRP